ncbi:MAG: inorganic polyphosphate/ATP-NAD kinase [Actinomycetota bacterium]
MIRALRVGIALHRHRPEVSGVVHRVGEWVANHGGTLVASPVDADAIDGDTVAAGEIKECDVVVSIGGDGTMLRAVSDLEGHLVPLIGVNLGSLGYLADVESEMLIEVLDRWVAGPDVGRWHFDDRMMVEALLDREGGPVVARALNEIAVEREEAGHMVRLQVAIDGAVFTTYAADGLIVATPTGSTAYSMSARGPILSPRLRALLVTPVSPHMLFDRSMVLDPSEEVEVTVLGHRSVAVSLDGLATHTLSPGAVIRFRASTAVARFVRFADVRFHQILKDKFHLNDR